MAQHRTNLPALASARLPARSSTKPESKADRFRRLANGRAGDAIAALERLGNLNHAAYEYDETQLVKLEIAIKDASKAAFDKLRTRTRQRVSTKSII